MFNMKYLKDKERNLNIDLIRGIATLFVIAIHFYMNTFYYIEPCKGIAMYMMTIFRSIFITCVPLFMIITGYLKSKKEISKKYYKPLIRIGLIYLLCSIACICFKKFYMNNPISLTDAILEILEFEGAPYSWYIAMYFGLFLLIPFVNLIWKNLKNKKQKQWLIGTFIILTFLPALLNIEISNSYRYLAPSWWISLYPLTYYFVGAYIEEYDIKISISTNIFLLILFTVLFGTLNFIRSSNNIFVVDSFTEYIGTGTFIIAILIFVLLIHIDLKKHSKFFKKIIICISTLSLSTYLLSYISDKLIYPIILINSNSIISTFKFFIPAVLCVFILSLIFAAIIELFLRIIYKICKLLREYIIKFKV